MIQIYPFVTVLWMFVNKCIVLKYLCGQVCLVLLSSCWISWMFCSKEPLLKLGDRSWSGLRREIWFFGEKVNTQEYSEKERDCSEKKKSQTNKHDLKDKKVPHSDCCTLRHFGKRTRMKEKTALSNYFGNCANRI